MENTRSIWAKEWLMQRNSKSVYFNILQELRLQDAENVRKYLHMNTDTFQYLLEKTRPLLTKQTTVMRVPISPEELLAVTLRFMATGESYRSLIYQYRISDVSISKIIPRVSDAIISTLMEECLPFPQRVEDWDKIEEGFRTRWQFPNCIGALDGKLYFVISS